MIFSLKICIKLYIANYDTCQDRNNMLNYTADDNFESRAHNYHPDIKQLHGISRPIYPDQDNMIETQPPCQDKL